MATVPLLTIAAYAAGLLLTLVLASFLTPASWWRRLNARALAVAVAGTWGIGSLLAALLPTEANASPPDAASPVAALEPRYEVFRALNLRSSTGTNAERIAVVPAGSLVAATGAREGDWWEIRATVGGRKVTGWVSSLWLRRPGESPAPR